MALSITQTESFGLSVRTCVLRAISGRPVPARVVAQAHLAFLDDDQWNQALELLSRVLMALDGRSAKKWGLTPDQGSRFRLWRHSRRDTVSGPKTIAEPRAGRRRSNRIPSRASVEPGGSEKSTNPALKNRSSPRRRPIGGLSLSARTNSPKSR